MHGLNELFAFSRAELIALATLLILALTGGGILLYERMQNQIPADVVFSPINVSASPTARSGETRPTAMNGDSSTFKTHRLQHSVTKLRININSAPAESLALLPHIGEVISARIIARRESRGRFESPAELISVRGIGPKYLQDILPYIVIE